MPAKREASQTKAIITPRVDAICGGGLSLAIAVAVIICGRVTHSPISQTLLAVELYMVTDVLINGPHFMASYRLLYSKPQNFRKHPIVTATCVSLNLHHYLTDAVIWKSRDPEVRQSIFGHLQPAGN